MAGEENNLLFLKGALDTPSYVDSLIIKAKAFYNEKDYRKAITCSLSVLELDDKNLDALSLLSYGYYYLNEEENAIYYCQKWVSSNIQDPKVPLALLATLYEKKAQREAQEKLEERSRTIADVSHSIKNLISTVIDPLENLKQRAGEERRVIENALRGANLVREIVNAMNLSSKGCLDDFYYDVIHNNGNDYSNLKEITIEALKYSVRNMFDGKYFGNFMREYFPTRELYIKAKSEWEEVSQNNDLNEIEFFLREYFFMTDFKLGDAEVFVIGNEKNSATKFLILFQEVIFNAVKYSAFTPKNNRFLRIHFFSDKNQILMKAENYFESRINAKSSGIGHMIIENFARLLGQKPIIHKENNVYSVQLMLENFWEGKFT